jgi:diacylglycerol O-acyltransferase / wax synthase
MSSNAMSPADAAWLHMDRRTNLMVINSVLWFDRPVDLWDVRDVFAERVLDRFPRFRQRIKEGLPGQSPSWSDDDAFEPDLHFHHLALPAPGDELVLQEVVSDLISAPLDRGRPLWEVYLLDGFGDGCALLIRMHHAIADGIALARVMLSLTDDADAQAGASFAPARPRPRGDGVVAAASLAAGAARAGAGLVRHPHRIGPVVETAVRDARSLVKLLAPGHDTPSPLRGDLAVAHRVAWSKPVPLSTVKHAGHALDASVNDVLVAAVAGALRTYLAEHAGQEVDELHALVPFNLRPLDEPLPRDLGNRFGLLLLGLPVGIGDPLERVAAVHESMQKMKASHEGALSYGILGAIGRTPAAVEARLVDFFSAKGTMVLTNVPGPRRTVTLAGTQVRGVLVWAPCSGSVGMSVSVFSYAGKVTVGFLVDSALVADPQPLADAFRADLLRIARRAGRAAKVG